MEKMLEREEKQGKRCVVGGAPRESSPPLHGGMEECVRLLQGGSDEEKFAGLMLVPKVAQSDKLEDVRRIYNALGLTFICRLLLSQGDEDTVLLYQCVALQVLGVFCAAQEVWPDLRQDKQFMKITPHLSRCLNNSTHPAMESLLTALLCWSSFEDSREILCDKDVPVRLTELIKTSQDKEGKERLFAVLDHLMDPSRFPQSAMKVLKGLSDIFGHNMGMEKIDALPRINVLLSCSEPQFCSLLVGDGQIQPWQENIREGLLELLRNRLGGVYRSSIFMAALHMFGQLGERWAFPKELERDGAPDGKFLQLLLGFAKLDLRERLEAKVKPEDNQQIVPMVLALVEKIIHMLGESLDEEEEGQGGKGGDLYRIRNMDVQRLLYMKADFEESVKAVFWYLDEMVESNKFEDPLLIPMARLLGLWFLEVDSDEFDEHFCSTLPVLCHFPPRRGSVRIRALHYLLPCLTEMVTRDKVMDTFVRYNGHVSTAQMLLEALEEDEKVAEDLDDVSLTDRCSAGVTLLSRVFGFRPDAVASSPVAFNELVCHLSEQAELACGSVGHEEEEEAGVAILFISLAFQVWRGVKEVGEKTFLGAEFGYCKLLAAHLLPWSQFHLGSLCMLSAVEAAKVHPRLRASMREAGMLQVLEREEEEGGEGIKDKGAWKQLREVLRREEGGEERGKEGVVMKKAERRGVQEDLSQRAPASQPQFPRIDWDAELYDLNEDAVWAGRKEKLEKLMKEMEEAGVEWPKEGILDDLD
ncbi:hypothetical protein GUITHDRAFT_104701 [Guillardia theta CCMP2712]|uniref:Uncharacterized protein n=1 Tax=Guillardia theta (strain CCMP2712) TaxID=905079 RepID=L1JNG9_GUITC|nr:hypothetical protein GUITHDRAFT_104701 [Guillardia theta CCMP2712]EKX49735.1 hypothetical protein GUITHDRAFT_104701 [Guillardia theta CCMP2712]|eukprot:XP_005836715.1 hypothetical protein GUITHDRAFT_104701 [Guillardia theta CCMP2712]